MTCQTHPVLCPGKACPDSAECKRLQRKVFKPCKHTCKHGIREDVDIALRSRSACEAGKVERTVRCKVLGGFYPKVGRSERIDSPDAFDIRQAMVSDMKHDLDSINRLPEAAI